MYNLKEAKRSFTKKAAFLACGLNYDDPDDPPNMRRVEIWRELVMAIIQQHRAAHEEITRLRAENEKLKERAEG